MNVTVGIYLKFPKVAKDAIDVAWKSMVTGREFYDAKNS